MRCSTVDGLAARWQTVPRAPGTANRSRSTSALDSTTRTSTSRSMPCLLKFAHTDATFSTAVALLYGSPVRYGYDS